MTKREILSLKWELFQLRRKGIESFLCPIQGPLLYGFVPVSISEHPKFHPITALNERTQA